jgi:hypothetical protein
MPLEETLHKVENDVKAGNLGKARDRLNGLIASFPDDLELRRKLGDIYWKLQYPDMAGKYWYLEENKSEKMKEACKQFENKFRQDPMFILFALKFKGDLDKIENTFAGKTLLDLHQKAKEKYGWYKDFRKRGSSKYYQPKYDREKHKVRDAIIKWGFVGLLGMLIFFVCIGGITVAGWIF